MNGHGCREAGQVIGRGCRMPEYSHQRACPSSDRWSRVIMQEASPTIWLAPLYIYKTLRCGSCKEEDNSGLLKPRVGFFSSLCFS